MINKKETHPTTTSCYVLNFNGTLHFQETLRYTEPTDRTAIMANPFDARITYYY